MNELLEILKKYGPLGLVFFMVMYVLIYRYLTITIGVYGVIYGVKSTIELFWVRLFHATIVDNGLSVCMTSCNESCPEGGKIIKGQT